MSKLIWTDDHAREDCLEELNDIYQEIYDNTPKNVFEYVNGGDLFDKKRPTPKEIDCITYWMHKFRERAQLHILKGNHTEIDDKTSAIDYLRHLSIDICDSFEHDGLFVGHFMSNNSLKNYGEWSRDKDLSSLVKYKYILLGHQHASQELSDNAWHLGSIRNVNFGEIDCPPKRIAIMDNDEIKFIELKSPIPMVEVFTVDNLTDINSRTKVRLTFKTFEQFKKEVNLIEKWKTKFTKLKIKLDFNISTDNAENKVTKSMNFRELVENWINTIEDQDVKEILKDAFKENI